MSLARQLFQEEIELTILMPCLNEAETLAICVDKARSFLEKSRVVGEVIVADNGSTDGSQSIAEKHGARVVHVENRGYGSALLGGINAARGRYIIMGDADDSYDFTALDGFVEKLREGYDLVMGNRFKGGIKPGAMPPLHRYLGNPVLSGIGRLFFKSPAGDFHCGLRGFNKDSILRLSLETPGMEFASEMVVKATLHQLNITEVPSTLSPDGRSRPPHLRSWRDGWRHLKFLLMYSPRWLFLIPGIILFAIGVICTAILALGSITISKVTFDINTMLYAAMVTILGVELMCFSIFSKLYCVLAGIMPTTNSINRILRKFSVEKGVLAGATLFLLGLVGSVWALAAWGAESFGNLIPGTVMRITIPSLTLVIVGVQTIFSSFLFGVISLKKGTGTRQDG
ncbi:glycosyltransferase family 2 protein [Cohnella zeiphila]|uniref:Glycosyltransferase family 2 protein n=1 Tax=Cohnella zeiphila TaxID=2761120 RepID=A0A7X0SLW2_9BACL|nr:glycosyltransferase family 2 protein [Cohnella zeiphila]MBB6732281.1 glycosyltransferase family 2 protein [Cohnella zeiphila]